LFDQKFDEVMSNTFSSMVYY